MTRVFGSAILIILLLTGFSAYAGEEGEAQARKGFLSFAFDPGKLFQVSPSGEPAGAEQAPSKDSDAKEVRDARAFVEFSLYGLFRYESNDGEPNTFDMPGAFVRGEGEWKNYKVSFMTNAAIADSLTWAYIDMAPWMNHKEKIMLRLGIFEVPFGQQIQTFPYDLGSIEYSLIVRDVTDIVGIYDMGLMFHGDFKVCDGGVNYAFGLLNGEHSRTTDTNNSKTVSFRLGFEFSPFFEVGGSYYKGNTTDQIWAFDYNYERLGTDLKWKPGNFNIRGEFISSVEDPDSHFSGSPPVFDPGVAERTEGWWIDIGVFVWINKKISDKYKKPGDKHERRGLEIYGHYQGFAPPPNEAMRMATGHVSRTQFVYGLGANLHLSRNVKLQVLWQHLDLGRYALGKYAGFDPEKQNDRFIMQLAVALF